MKLKSGPSVNGQGLRRTFPTKRNPAKKGASHAAHIERTRLQGEKKVKRYGKKSVQKNTIKGETKTKKEFLLDVFEKEGVECTEEIKLMVYRKCYILLHGIARVSKGELEWNDEQKNDLFFSRVSLPYLKTEIHPTHAENEHESHLVASYSFFKYLICTCGIVSGKDRQIFIQLILKLNECEMAIMAAHMNTLLLALSLVFGPTISIVPASYTNSSSFTNARSTFRLEMMRMSNENTRTLNKNSKEKDLPSFLAEMYCEIEKNREKIESKKVVFESSDDEEEDGNTSKASSNARKVLCGQNEDKVKQISKKIKREVKDEETVKKEVKTEVESEDEKEKKKRAKSNSPNGWNDEMEIDEIQNNRPSTSNSVSSEFRSNLVDLAKESWSKSVALYSIVNEPSVNDRFKMARFVIECLEKKYGDELLEFLQFFTFQSFDARHLTEKEEVIGLMLYLDQRKLVAESFFFLLLAMNDKKNARIALDECEPCCRAQLGAAKIARSVLLGKPLQAQQLAANREALDNRKNLEYNKYHIIFPGIIRKDTMKQVSSTKMGEARELKKEIIKNCVFADLFWTSSAKFFNVDSEWTTFAVNESAVRVFEEINMLFEGSLPALIRTMNCHLSHASLSDIRSGASMAALHRMKSTGFFTDSLLFALLRFNDAEALKKSCSKLKRLCDAFKKVVETGSQSKSLKTDSHFKSLKSNFAERAMKVNADCMKYFEALMNFKGRKRCLSTSSTVTADERGEDEKEPRKRKIKETVEDEKKETKKKKKLKEENGDDTAAIEKKKVKDEDNEVDRKKKKKEKKVEKEETSDDDGCQIIDVEKKKVKVEVISSDDEEENEKKKRKKETRDSKRSIDGDAVEKEKQQSDNDSSTRELKKEVKKEVKKEGEDEKDSSLDVEKNGSVSGFSIASHTSSTSIEKPILPTDESSWEYNQRWKVTTMWNQTMERKQWEKEHKSDMDRLSHRINDFMVATAMREEHYEKKVKVFEWIKNVLKDYMEKTESTMDITGSSLCLVGSALSNLDIFIKSARRRTDQQVIINILKQEKGLHILPFRGIGSIYTTLTNEITDGILMYVDIHVMPSTHYMGRVYQTVDHQDERVAALSLVLKAWRLLDPLSIASKIQSYHLMIMLIHYLQCGVSPPILPALALFYPNLEPHSYRTHELPEPIPSENTESLATLLIGFFAYYSLFEFEKYIISVKGGCLIKRDERRIKKAKREENARKITMEHPFDNYLTKPKGVFTAIEYASIRSLCKIIKNGLTSSFNIPSLSSL